MIVVRLVALLLAALATGGLMVNWIGLARAMARISSAAAYTEFHQATNRTFDPYMPMVVFGAIAGGVALAVASSGAHSAPGWLPICGATCYAAVIVITLSTNLPTNSAIAGWSVESPPDQLEGDSRRLDPMAHSSYPGVGPGAGLLPVVWTAREQVSR